MDTSTAYLLAADAVLLLHVVIVIFVVAGLAAVLAGQVLGWSWVRNPWFRWAHLLAIGIVVAQSWLGVICPLTTLEMALRARAGDAVYTGSFVAHWLGQMLYFRAPWWVFAACYTGFAALVVYAWVRVPPRPLRRQGPLT